MPSFAISRNLARSTIHFGSRFSLIDIAFLSRHRNISKPPAIRRVAIYARESQPHLAVQRIASSRQTPHRHNRMQSTRRRIRNEERPRRLLSRVGRATPAIAESLAECRIVDRHSSLNSFAPLVAHSLSGMLVLYFCSCHPPRTFTVVHCRMIQILDVRYDHLHRIVAQGIDIE